MLITIISNKLICLKINRQESKRNKLTEEKGTQGT